MGLYLGDQVLSDLHVKELCLLLHERLHCFFDLLLDYLRQGCLHCLGDGLLDLNLQVFLRLHLLLQTVHLHVQLRELLVQLLIVLDDLILLLLLCLRYTD